jgi:hypothetical protein
MKLSSIIAGLFLLVISAFHLLRLVFQVPIAIGGFEIPIWISIPACILIAALAIWLWTDNRTRSA